LPVATRSKELASDTEEDSRVFFTHKANLADGAAPLHACPLHPAPHPSECLFL